MTGSEASDTRSRNRGPPPERRPEQDGRESRADPRRGAGLVCRARHTPRAPHCRASRCHGAQRCRDGRAHLKQTHTPRPACVGDEKCRALVDVSGHAQACGRGGPARAGRGVCPTSTRGRCAVLLQRRPRSPARSHARTNLSGGLTSGPEWESPPPPLQAVPPGNYLAVWHLLAALLA
jgi:hypothetical protein